MFHNFLPTESQYISIYSFGQVGSAVAYDWYIWNKPNDIKFVCFMIIGAGGSGGTVSTSGSIGGSSGNVSQIIYPAIFVPNQLYICPGNSTSSAATPTIPAYVSLSPNQTTSAWLLGLATGGVAGSTSAVAAETKTTAIFTTMGLSHFEPGAPGAAVGASLTAMTGHFLTGGAGGGNSTPSSGGNITGAGWIPTTNGGAGTSAAAGTAGDGSQGVLIWKPFCASGGAGGGGASDNKGTGGDGGRLRASFGCGGGGSGYGKSASGTNSGGNGLILVSCW